MKTYKVTNFSVDSRDDIIKHLRNIEYEINEIAEEGCTLVATPTNESDYDLLIFEKTYDTTK